MTTAPLATGGTLNLDAVYPDAAPGRAVVFATYGTVPADLGTITALHDGGVKGFGLSGRTSQITVAGINLTTGLNSMVRETIIHLETSRETLFVPEADVQTPDPVTPDRITVAGLIPMLTGRRLILTGTDWTSGAQVSEIAILKSATVSAATATTPASTALVMETALQTRFHSAGLTVLGNCVSASQGETPVAGPEVIGSGNPSTATPRFPLKLQPLAHLATPATPGYAPELEVRVAGRLYDPVRSIFGLPADSNAYQISQTGDGMSVVQFAGRLPSGIGNVTALYRKGGGAAGNIAAGRLTTLLSPVIGVRSVINPLPSDGGSDAETLNDVRQAAPASIRTLDRVVSLADYQSFAQTYPGVGKALATELRSGMRRLVCLTIATTTLVPPFPGSSLPTDLRDALALVTVPGRSVMIAGFTALAAQVTVGLVTDPALDRTAVESAVRTRLAVDFSGAARGFGQALHRSQVIESAQSVAGVIAVTLPVFVLLSGPQESDGRLLCPGPAFVGGAFVPAGLLSLHPDQIAFVEVAP